MNEKIGSLPPQNVEAEERVLGAILLDPGCIPDVLSILKPEHFYRASHRAIYEAMLRVRASGEAVDMLTVADALKRAGKLEAAGGPEAVARLADDVSTARRAPSHARLIRDSYKLRALIQAAKSIEERAATGESDGADILNDALAAIQEIASDQAESVAVFTAQEMEGMEIERPPDLAGDPDRPTLVVQRVDPGPLELDALPAQGLAEARDRDRGLEQARVAFLPDTLEGCPQMGVNGIKHLARSGMLVTDDDDMPPIALFFRPGMERSIDYGTPPTGPHIRPDWHITVLTEVQAP